MHETWSALTRFNASVGPDRRSEDRRWRLNTADDACDSIVGWSASDATDCPSRLPFCEEVRYLVSRLYHLRHNLGVRSVLLTSTVPKEGKTLIAANLAAMLARGGARVVLIDGDFRRPSLHRLLGVSHKAGLSQVLAGGVPVLDAIQQVDSSGLCFLPAGSQPEACAERLQDAAARQSLINGLKPFDWVILDSPPMAVFADAHILAMLCDAVLLVVRVGVAPAAALSQAVAMLSSANIVGIVLNGSVDAPRAAYYYDYPGSRSSR